MFEFKASRGASRCCLFFLTSLPEAQKTKNPKAGSEPGFGFRGLGFRALKMPLVATQHIELAAAFAQVLRRVVGRLTNDPAQLQRQASRFGVWVLGFWV